VKCDGTRAEIRFCLSAKRTIPFKSAGASVQSTAGSRGVRISGSNAGYTMFRGSVKSTGYPLHAPVSPSLPLPCVTVCHHISTGLLRVLLFTVLHHTTHSVGRMPCFHLQRRHCILKSAMARAEPKTRSNDGTPFGLHNTVAVTCIGSTFLNEKQPGASNALYGTVLGDQSMKQPSDL